MQTHTPEESAAWAPVMSETAGAEGLAPEPAIPPTPLDRVFEPIASRLPICGNGAPGGWSVRVADAIIPGDGCGCCTVWRSMFLGAALAFVVSGAIALGVRAFF